MTSKRLIDLCLLACCLLPLANAQDCGDRPCLTVDSYASLYIDPGTGDMYTYSETDVSQNVADSEVDAEVSVCDYERCANDSNNCGLGCGGGIGWLPCCWWIP